MVFVVGRENEVKGAEPSISVLVSIAASFPPLRSGVLWRAPWLTHVPTECSQSSPTECELLCAQRLILSTCKRALTCSILTRYLL